MTALLAWGCDALPFIAFSFLLLGAFFYRPLLIVSLWVTIFALLIHYKLSGGEILGNYFNYYHAFIYSVNLLVLMALTLLLITPELQNKKIRYIVGLLASLIFTGSVLILSNIWINAHFIETRLSGSPVLQVSSFTELPYCNYPYVFYKTHKDHTVRYMCPNYYGFLPSVGILEVPKDWFKKKERE